MSADTETRSAKQAPDLRCHSCESPMKLRKDKHGLFYGCTAYPLCNVIIRFQDVKEKPTPEALKRAHMDSCYRAIPAGSKLHVSSKRQKIRGAWTVVTRFDYV